MSKLSSFRRIYKTDYPMEYQNFVEQLSLPINNGFDTLYSVLNRNVSLSDNISCTVKTVDVKVDTTGKPTVNTSFSVKDNVKVIGYLVISAICTETVKVYPTGGVFLTANQNNTTITIENVSGLPANSAFTLTIVAFN